jgi:hypothetical protein
MITVFSYQNDQCHYRSMEVFCLFSLFQYLKNMLQKYTLRDFFKQCSDLCSLTYSIYSMYNPIISKKQKA